MFLGGPAVREEHGEDGMKERLVVEVQSYLELPNVTDETVALLPNFAAPSDHFPLLTKFDVYTI
jgi:hypothetical protein